MDELITELVADLKAELTLTDENFNESLLTAKVNKAVKDVKLARNYPSSYTDDMIDEDMDNFYSVIRDLALYDYNTVGAEYEKSHNENSVNRSWIDRNSLFSGIIPLAH